MNFRDELRFGYLLDLQRRLRFIKYDELELENLDKLRVEVDDKVAKVIAEGKKRNEGLG